MSLLLSAVPPPYKLLAAVALIVSCFGFGYVKGLQSAERDAFKTANKMLQAAIDDKARVDQKLRQLTHELQTGQTKTKVIYRQIERKVDEATDNRVCFTPESLSLWNDAISGSNSMPKAPTRTSEIPGAAGATDRQLLRNAIKNFETCNGYRNQIIAIIEADRLIHEGK